MGNACLGIISFYFLIMFSMIIGPLALKDQSPSDISPIMMAPDGYGDKEYVNGVLTSVPLNDKMKSLPSVWKGHRGIQKYAMCDQSWGSPFAPVTPLDLGELSWLMYEP